MLSWAKYVLVFFAIGLVVLLGNHFFSQQKLNTLSIQEVEVALKTQAVGILRNSGGAQVSKQALVNELVAEVVQTQKNHGKSIRVSYVFLDSDGVVTEVEPEISSVQFRVELLGKDNRVEASSEQRLALTEHE